ncbi:hypothetical protein V8J88_02385 [Massilia sp. W12]|uniref:hypothetical protein n=1 Tax=Massilia sp. W12 TaxID=3126507 RepID=UPI0030D53A32
MMNKYLLSIGLMIAALYHGWLAELQAGQMNVKEAASICQQQNKPAESNRELL